MADGEVKVRKERDPIFSVCFVVFVIAAAAVLGSSLYNNYVKTDDTLAASGNTVEVNYVGTYYAYFGEKDAVIFDTSRWSVADSDATKSNDYEAKAGGESKYTPLKFTVGGTDVLSMFGNAVIGHKIGEKVRVMIPVGQGYTSADTAKTVSYSSVFASVPTVQKLTSAQFEKVYGYKLTAGPVDLKSPYGWQVTAVYNTADDTVSVYNKPEVGTGYVAQENGFGKVTITPASIGTDIEYRLSVSDYTEVDLSGGNGIQMIKLNLGGETIYITEATTNNFSYKTVEERYNQALFFEIEIVSIS